jgi:hypothetical protein
MTNGYEQDRQALREQAERAAEADKERRGRLAQGVDERMAERDRSVAEFYEREAGVKPTPTQRENDLAKVGALDIDDKEPDGSESDEEHQHRVMQGRLPGNNPYVTRDLGSGEARRGPGRPRKNATPPEGQS